MPKQVMNYNKLTFYILFGIIYVTQLSQCKVVYRREEGEGTNAGQENLIPSGEGTKDQQPNLIEANDAVDQQPSKDADGAVENEENPKDADGVIKEDQPESIEAGGAVENPKDDDGIKKDQPDSIEAGGIKEGQPADSIEPDGIKEGQPADSIEPDGTVEDQQSPDADGTNAKHHPKDGAENGNGCWISFNEHSHFEEMNQLEQKYKNAKDAYEKDVDTQALDQGFLSAMVQTRGIAERALQKFRGNPHVIPAGLNLGSNCMMRLPGSMLFFYRLKLRNDTRFTVNFIHNDLNQLTLTLRLSLNDLHLVGQYDRALTAKEDPSKLYYRPNKGEVEFLLQDVKYKVEGRYRLLDGRLHLEHVISEIPPMSILMRYTLDNDGKSTPLDPISLRDYLNRMQVDLDHWLKDYFNDFLMLYGTAELKKNNEIQQYENEKTVLLNHFTDQVMDILNNRVKIKGPDFMMPNFHLTAANGMEIKLYDGVVRGLNSMYRRSVATSKRVNEVRFVDADIGFSKLKSEYRYDVFVKTGVPPVSGVFVLNSEDVSAHMALQIVGYKPSVPDLLITYMNHGKPESLTVEGPANRIIANFKHLLENHIISIMTSTLIHQIRSLSALAQCDPRLPVQGGADKDTVTDGEHYENDGQNYITTPMKPQDDDFEPSEMPDNKTDDDGPTEQPDNENDEDGPSEHPGNENDDGPTELPDNSDDDRPTEQPDNSDDDGPTEQPDNSNNDGPTEQPEHSDDDKPTEHPDKSDDDGPTEQPDNSNNDGPTEQPEHSDDDKPTEHPDKSDDDGPTEQPDNSDNDGPTEQPDNSDNDGPTEQPEHSDDDKPTEHPGKSDDDGPTEQPDNSDDDGPTEQPDVQNSDVPSEPTEDNNDADPTESPEYTRDEPSESEHNDDVTEPPYPSDKKPEYAFDRKESIELELPSKDGSGQGESYKIDHNETFSLTKLNNDDDRSVLSAAGDTGNVAALKKDNRGQVVKLMGSTENE